MDPAFRGVHFEKTLMFFFDAIYRKCASISSDVSVRNINVLENRVLFLTLHHKALEKISRDANLETKGTIYSKLIQIFSYFEDIDIVSWTINSIKEAFLALSKAASNMRLTINEEKTKFMQVTSKSIIRSELLVGEQKFEVFQQFKYLGTIVTNDNNLDKKNYISNFISK